MNAMIPERGALRAVLAAALALLAGSWPSAQEPLTLVRTIDLPRVEGRIDHLAFDAAPRRRCAAARGHNTGEGVDVTAGRDLRSLPGFHEPQGIAVATDAKQIAIAN